MTVEALQDNQLIAVGAAGALASSTIGRVLPGPGGDIVVLSRLARARPDLHGLELRAAADAAGARARRRPIYPEPLERYLVRASRRAAVPDFGTPRPRSPHDGLLRRATSPTTPSLRSYRAALRARARDRGRRHEPVRGGRRARGVVPPDGRRVRLRRASAAPAATSRRSSSSCTQTKRGYCQHFAGAMALMLRYLGIPARVAAGFTSGSYDEDKQRVDRDRPRRARLGRGLVPAAAAGSRSTRRPAAATSTARYTLPRSASTPPRCRPRIAGGPRRRRDSSSSTERFDRGRRRGRGRAAAATARATARDVERRGRGQPSSPARARGARARGRRSGS